MVEAIFGSRFPGYVDIFLDHVERTNAEGLAGEQQAAAVWKEARPTHRQLTACGLVIDAAEWRRMIGSDAPCSAAVDMMLQFLSSAESFSKEVDALEDKDLLEKHARLAITKDIKRNELGAEADKFAFFNEPRCALDQAHWNSLESWSIDEAAAIHFRKDPRFVSLSTLSPMNPVRRSPFRRSYGEFIEYLKRALSEQDTTKQIDRAKIVRIPVFSAEAREALFCENDGTSTPSRHSMYRIILALAIKHYELDVRASTAESVVFNKKAALKDIDMSGINLTDKTFLKYLGEAIDYSKKKELFRKSF